MNEYYKIKLFCQMTAFIFVLENFQWKFADIGDSFSISEVFQNQITSSLFGHSTQFQELVNKVEVYKNNNHLVFNNVFLFFLYVYSILLYKQYVGNVVFFI